jgi:hypothetical protein
MSKEALNKVLEQIVKDRELNHQVETGFKELEQRKQHVAQQVFSKFDLTAEEREALISKDFLQLQALGASLHVLKRADWCTGD